MITFTVPAVPLAQPRPRSMIIGGRVHTYNPTHRKNADGQRVSNGVPEFKATVRQSAQFAYKGAPLDGALFLRIVFVMPRPKNMCWKSKPMPRHRHTGKPDLDNLAKSVKDALKGIVWRDDSQVCSGKWSKWIAAGDEAPHVEVEIRQLDAEKGLFA